MGKGRKKPTGDMGNSLKLTSEGSFRVEPFRFPDRKDEIEIKIARLFLELIQKSGVNDLHGLTLTQNNENDLDFSLESDSVKYLLELTEITPPGDMKGGYRNLSYSHNVGEHAQKIIDLISKKSAKYEAISDGIVLLAYITDQRSSPSVSTEKLVMQHLRSVDTSFDYVFLLIPIMENDGPLIQYYPNDSECLSSEDVELINASTVHNLREGPVT